MSRDCFIALPHHDEDVITVFAGARADFSDNIISPAPLIKGMHDLATPCTTLARSTPPWALTWR
jgi:hypothetical protein